jgi:hypothetical protein
MIVTVKRRFQRTLMQRLGNFADSSQGCGEDLQDFISIFSEA